MNMKNIPEIDIPNYVNYLKQNFDAMTDIQKKEELAFAKQQINRLELEKEELIAQKNHRAKKLAYAETMLRYMSCKDDIKPEKINNSILYQLFDAAENKQVLYYTTNDVTNEEWDLIPNPELCKSITKAGEKAQRFVVRHNWYGVLSEEIDNSLEVKLPFPECFFEMQIFGIRWVVFATQYEDQSFPNMFLLSCASGIWCMSYGHTEKEHRAGKLLRDTRDEKRMSYPVANVLAACIALNAEIADDETKVRAPVALNKKRTANGKSPLLDYSVVDLTKRHRDNSHVSSNSGSGVKKRLHFRRGHLRRYIDKNVWVKWCLVGNPDLGFINKHYKA